MSGRLAEQIRVRPVGDGFAFAHVVVTENLIDRPFVDNRCEDFDTWASFIAQPEHSPEAMGRPARVDDHGGEVYVYRRAGQACHVCGSRVRTEILSGRNLFWCPRCQPAFRSRAVK